MSHFNIMDSAAQLLDFRILESIHIINNRPEINNNQTAMLWMLFSFTG